MHKKTVLLGTLILGVTTVSLTSDTNSRKPMDMDSRDPFSEMTELKKEIQELKISIRQLKNKTEPIKDSEKKYLHNKLRAFYGPKPDYFSEEELQSAKRGDFDLTLKSMGCLNTDQKENDLSHQ